MTQANLSSGMFHTLAIKKDLNFGNFRLGEDAFHEIAGGSGAEPDNKK